VSRRYFLPLLAIAGFGVALVVALRGRPTPPSSPLVTLKTPAPPFETYVAAVGIVEAMNGNIAIGSPVVGIVDRIYVEWGQKVQPGTPLFALDARDLEARLAPARARVEEATADLERAEHRLQVADRMGEEAILSDEEVTERRFDAEAARARLTTLQAELEQIESEIAIRTIRAPAAGTVLKIGIRPGELAEGGPGTEPLMVLGNEERFAVRVDVDESDAWRVQPGAEAFAFVRGNPDLGSLLRFERVEPLLVPKTSLTGASAERTDTRVLQVVYSVDRDSLPVYAGQLLDVYIEASS